MREIDMLKDLPQATDRPAIKRTIHDRITACERSEEFFWGSRSCGYGGMSRDGRWKPVAKRMFDEYNLQPTSSVLQFGSELGYLTEEFRNLGCDGIGVEWSEYCLDHDRKAVSVEDFKIENNFNKTWDLVIAIGPVYCVDLARAINLLMDIERIGKRAFITLGSFDTTEDERIFREWSLLGCTILSKPDWIEVLKHCGYTGDYKFVTAKTLGLV